MWRVIGAYPLGYDIYQRQLLIIVNNPRYDLSAKEKQRVAENALKLTEDGKLPPKAEVIAATEMEAGRERNRSEKSSEKDVEEGTEERETKVEDVGKQV